MMNPKLFQNWLNLSSKSFNKGINFGHKSIKLTTTPFFHPLQSHFILGIRKNVSLFNTQQTFKYLLRAFHILALVLKKKGRVMIINTNPEFYKLCSNLATITLQSDYLRSMKKFPKILPVLDKLTNRTPNILFETAAGSLFKSSFYSKQNSKQDVWNRASKSNQIKNRKKLKTPLLSYISYKWVGGTLTNWKQVSKSVLTYAKFSQRCENFMIKNNLDFPKFTRVKKCFQGLLYRENQKMIVAFDQKPDLIFLINPNENLSLLNEASRLHIPVIALTESSTNPKEITYPIPVNNYSMKFIYFCLKKIIKITHF